MSNTFDIKEIEGDLAVEHDCHVGGDSTTQGDQTIKGDLIVEGWLIAKNVKYEICKGFFLSYADLISVFPSPQYGWWAIVGASSTATLYVANESREWTSLATESKIVYRGEFSSGASYYCDGFNPATNSYETSAVWYRGCKYHCARNLTTATPCWNTTDWVMVEGNPDFEVDLTETDGIYDPDTFDVNLNIIATLYNQDITADVKDIDVVWSRYSQDNNGNERPDSDTAWAIKNASKGKEIHLTRDDCDFNGYIPKRLKFTATVTLRDDAGNAIANNTITFGY